MFPPENLSAVIVGPDLRICPVGCWPPHRADCLWLSAKFVL